MLFVFVLCIINLMLDSLSTSQKGQKNMHVVLMVAEKPSLAESLAKLLSRNNHNSRRGINNACHVHEWNGTFRGEQVRYKMTSVCGHVMTLDFQSRYNNWDAVDPVSSLVFLSQNKIVSSISAYRFSRNLSHISIFSSF